MAIPFNTVLVYLEERGGKLHRLLGKKYRVFLMPGPVKLVVVVQDGQVDSEEFDDIRGWFP